MTQPTLSDATYIDNERDLNKLVEHLREETQIAFDTESNSMYAYRGRTCLIQLSTRTQDFIVDPLLINDIHVLGEIFASPKIEKIVHAAEYDSICLKRDFDFDVVNVFDTMAAARVCGYPRVGLSAVLENVLGIEHDKRHQTDDWGKRPLPDGYIKYAQMDTHYLIEVRDCLYEELQDLGRIEEAYEFFEDVMTFEVKPHEFDPEGFWDVGNPQSLTRRQMAILREIYVLRDRLAQDHDYPTHRLIGNKALVTIVQELPEHRNELYGIRTMPDWVVRQHGDEIMQALEKGRSSRLPNRPPIPPPPAPDVVERYTALHTWRKTRAHQRGVDADVIISKHTLWDVARKQPDSVEELRGMHGIGAWRLKTYGPDLINVLKNHSSSL